MTIDDLVSWGWSTALASTGVVVMYWLDVIAGAILLVLGLAGMHAVRARLRRRTGGSGFVDRGPEPTSEDERQVTALGLRIRS
jgi:hypothetical protein